MKTTTTAAALVAAGLVLAACSAGSGSSGSSSTTSGTGGSTGQAAVDTDRVRIGLVAEPSNLDFTRTDGAAIPQALLGNVYETLVKVDQEGEIQPSLATKYTVSKDRRTYTFTLNTNVVFHNGTALTADDVVYSINQVKKRWTVSLKSAMDVVTSAKATNPTTVTVTLSRPSNQWLYAMTTRVGAIFDDKGTADLANRPIGSGPYEFKEWKRGQSIALARNSHYWGEKPTFDNVSFQYFKDPNALNSAMLSGGIDVIGTVQAPESLDQFGNGDYQVIQGTTNGEVVLSFNNGKGIFTDKKARQAVRYAIDHQALLDTCWAGRGTLIGSMVPPTDPWYEDRTGDYPYNPDKAKQLVGELTTTTIRLRVPTLPYATACGQVVESQLKDVGFDVTTDQLEFPATWLTEVFTNADYDASIVAHVEPRDLGAVFGNPKYYTRYNNPTLRAALAKADRGTPEQQISEMKDAARIISEDAAADFLFLMPNLMVAKPGITGLPQNAITESFDLAALGTN